SEDRGIGCRDFVADGNKLLNLCRDWLAAALAGPEMLLVSDLAARRSFYLGRSEVSVGEFNTYCRLSGDCQPLAEAEGLPATGISAAAVYRYAGWLSKVTGQRYRLPTNREWLLAAENGGANAYCGDSSVLRTARAGRSDDL